MPRRKTGEGSGGGRPMTHEPTRPDDTALTFTPEIVLPRSASAAQSAAPAPAKATPAPDAGGSGPEAA